MGFRLMKDFNMIFPAEIISDILTRLPTELVMETKLVCKTWNNLIHHPSFPKMHLARLNHPDSPDSGKLIYVILKSDDDIDDDDVDDDDLNKRIYCFEYKEDWNHVTPIHRKISIQTPYCEAYILIGSFNGLICIYGTRPSFYDSHGPAIIFNPVTKEYIVLPDFDRCQKLETKASNSVRCNHLACGFGYLAEKDEYKVVRIYKHATEVVDVIEVEVYTVGSGKGWRHVGKFALGFRFYPHFEHTHGVFLNGCLHWRNTYGGMVVVFDLADEKFLEHISPPPLLTDTDDDDDYAGNIMIGVSGGGILYYAVHQSIQGQQFNDVWFFMNINDNLETEEHQSWGWVEVNSLDQRQPFAFLESGTVIRYDQGTLKSFVPLTSTWENILYNDMSRQVFPYKHTLVSLKELGEQDTKIMEAVGLEETDSSESDSN